jgi:hypothetical protein
MLRFIGFVTVVGGLTLWILNHTNYINIDILISPGENAKALIHKIESHMEDQAND